MEGNFEKIRFVIEAEDGSYGGEFSPSREQNITAIVDIIFDDYFDEFRKEPSVLKAKIHKALENAIKDIYDENLYEIFYDDLKEYFEEIVRVGGDL